MRNLFSRKVVVLLVTLIGGFFLAKTTLAADVVNVSWGVAIKGYDPVAYFVEQKPVKGNDAYSFEWMGAKWRFSSEQNRQLFAASPQKYAPQYGGYCAYGVSQGKKVGIDPEAWSVADGKLYLNYDLDIRDKKWLLHQDDLIKKADENWLRIK